jgi:hypothetical protein
MGTHSATANIITYYVIYILYIRGVHNKNPKRIGIIVIRGDE